MRPETVVWGKLAARFERIWWAWRRWTSKRKLYYRGRYSGRTED